MTAEELIKKHKAKNLERVIKYNNKQKEKGLVEVSVWVKAENRETLKELAMELRK